MKKRILIISISLVCLIVPSVLVIAKNQTTDEDFPRYIDFKLEVFRAGQLSEKKLLVSMEIWKLDNGSFVISWKHIHIEPLHFMKKIFLNSRYFSTGNVLSKIKNVSVYKDSFSFRLEHAEGLGLTADVVGKRKEGQNSYLVEANAIDFVLGADSKKTAEIWKSTDKAIVLPYREIAWASATNSNQTEKSSTIDAKQE